MSNHPKFTKKINNWHILIYCMCCVCVNSAFVYACVFLIPSCPESASMGAAQSLSLNKIMWLDMLVFAIHAINESKSAARNLWCHLTITNLEAVRIKWAKGHRTILIAKKNSWKSFVSKIKKNTLMWKIWNVIYIFKEGMLKEPTKWTNYPNYLK